MTTAQSLPTTPAAQLQSPIPGMNVMLMGPVGSGKTTSLKTLADAGLEVFGVFLDTSAEVINHDPRIHWRYLPPARPSWADLSKISKLINTMSASQISDMKGMEKQSFMQALDLITLCNDFVDNKGKHWGDIAKWNTDRVIFLDPLSGLNRMFRTLTVGAKPSPSQPEWGIMMGHLEQFINKLCLDTQCHFVLTAHVEPERDEVSGIVKNMVSTLGRKLAPVLPVNFSDVILAQRDDKSFYWTTSDSRTDLKARHLPLADRIQPSFVPLVAEWKKQGGVICSTVL